MPGPVRLRPLAFILAGALVALPGCSTSSVTCACTRPEGGTDLIDIKGGSCSDFEGGQQGYTSCSPVVLFNTIMGPGAGASSSAPLPSLDQPWHDLGR